MLQSTEREAEISQIDNCHCKYKECESAHGEFDRGDRPAGSSKTSPDITDI